MNNAAWHVYLIRNGKGDLYAGITTDLERRLNEHREGAAKGAKALRGKGPLEMVWSQRVANRSEASKLEAQIKKLTKAKKEGLATGAESILAGIDQNSVGYS